MNRATPTGIPDHRLRRVPCMHKQNTVCTVLTLRVGGYSDKSSGHVDPRELPTLEREYGDAPEYPRNLP